MKGKKRSGFISIEESYNSWSTIYDSNENKTRDLDKFVTQKVLSSIDFDTVLELGCGSGKNTEWLIEKASRIIGLDFSEGMLAIAKGKINSSNVQFVKGNLNQKWDIPIDFADLITCSLTLEHIENLDHVFNQAFENLDSNGYFFISELHPFKQYLGSKARFEEEWGLHELKVYTHHISDYLRSAESNGFVLEHIDEWFDNDKSETPRLISFMFRKSQT